MSHRGPSSARRGSLLPPGTWWRGTVTRQSFILDRGGVWRSDHRSDRGLLRHSGHAARWCDSLRLVGRPFGTPGTADDFDPMVFGVQFTGRALADLHLSVHYPRAAGHRDGRGVAGRRGAGNGILAGALTGTDV